VNAASTVFQLDVPSSRNSGCSSGCSDQITRRIKLKTTKGKDNGTVANQN